ncbi:hypothetical protein VTH82DRAFT_3058 [Thermothelomyces myriococcoides]
MPKRRLLLLAASIAAVRTAAASAIFMDQLFARQSSCLPNYFRCENAEFPDYFCCKGKETCIPLAGDTTLLCCPEGSDCQRIRPVPCDIELQNGEKNPDAVIKTTALGGTLPRCGTQCCPFGYSCIDGQCAKDRNQNAVPIQTRTSRPEPTTTTTTTRDSDATTTSTDDTKPTGEPTETTQAPGATSEPSLDDDDDDETESSGGGPPVAAIAGGATAAGVVLIGAAALAFYLFWKKKKDEDGSKKGRSPLKLSRSTSSFGNLISRPVMANNSANIDSEDAFVRPSGSEKYAQGMEPELEPDSVTGAVLGSSINSPESGSVPAAAVLHHQQGGGVGRAYGGGYGGLEEVEEQQQQQPEYVHMPYANYESSSAYGRPLTPPRRNVVLGNNYGDREPSSVSINVFADPNITPDRSPESNNVNAATGAPRYSNMTSFTQMLDSVGMGGIAHGESYLNYEQRNGGLAPPSSRR